MPNHFTQKVLWILSMCLCVHSQCGATVACNNNRVCWFGSLTRYNYNIEKLFEATGYPLSCINSCSCSNNPVNAVQLMLNRAAQNNTLYANNEICNNPVMYWAMVYSTAGFACETIVEQAQQLLILLCGTQNGIPCNGRCTEQYQIDTPPRPCDSRSLLNQEEAYWELAYTVALIILIAWSVDYLKDSENLPTHTKKERHHKPTVPINYASLA